MSSSSTCRQTSSPFSKPRGASYALVNRGLLYILIKSLFSHGHAPGSPDIVLVERAEPGNQYLLFMVGGQEVSAHAHPPAATASIAITSAPNVAEAGVYLVLSPGARLSPCGVRELRG